MDELNENQKDHLDAALLFSELSRMVILDYLLISITDPSEKVEEWALNGLRSYGEIKRKYKDNTSLKELSGFVSKIVDFYFKNTEIKNDR